MATHRWGALCVGLSLSLFSFGCGKEDVELANDGGIGGDGGSGIDAEFYPFDGGFGGACTAGDAQCNNCVDDDATA